VVGALPTTSFGFFFALANPVMTPTAKPASRSSRPQWLKVRLPGGENYAHVRSLLRELHLHTVCESARCPNVAECWNQRTATFMILGDTCTRSCRFCAVSSGQPAPVDPQEPERVTEAAARLGLEYVVVTSVTRDDVPDGGAAQFAATIRALRRRLPDCRVEVLIPDFLGNHESLKKVVSENPTVLNHNVETVPRLYPLVRPQAEYRRSLALLRRVKEWKPSILTKSGLMVGLGETDAEVTQTLTDLRNEGCDLVTIGQYLQPSRRHLPVARYYTPEEFARLRALAEGLGFTHVESGPLVRSSYHAAAAAGCGMNQAA